MTLYAYKAIDAAGRRTRGRMEAAGLAELEQRLARMGLDFIDAAPSRPHRWLGDGVPRRELIHFCFHLEQLAVAGVPLIESLIDLRDSMSHPRLRDVLAAMVESIEGGSTLSAAMAAHPGAFDGVMVGLVRAGEESGCLPAVLAKLAARLKWQDEMAARLRRAILYPAFLSLLVMAVLLFVGIFLLPQLAGFMRSMGQVPPWHLDALAAATAAVVRNWPLAVAIVGGGGVGTFLAARDARGRRAMDRLALRLPLIGELLRKAVLARFAATFAMMYGAGIAVLDAMRATEEVAGNAVVGNAIALAGGRVRNGAGIAAAFAASGLFPSLVIRMLRIGEQTGELEKAMDNVAYFYERDVRDSVERIQALLEPALTVIVGLVVGGVMVAVLGPIYDAVARIKV